MSTLDDILRVVAKDSPLHQLLEGTDRNLCADVTRTGKQCQGCVNALKEALRLIPPPGPPIPKDELPPPPPPPEQHQEPTAA
jgi:hypothetical protein